MAPPITRVLADTALADLDQFDTIIDVRSPTEFADDHIPGAINLPVLDDQQRAEIGTIYKKNQPVYCKTGGRRTGGTKYRYAFTDQIAG